jgi:hypothetical protein
VVDVPRGTQYQLYVAQNPENAVEVTLYRENGERLERVEQPVSGNSTQVFWMDLWTARDAPVARIKVEPQLHVSNDWVIYPMEARVMNATVPEGENRGPILLPEPMRRYLCKPLVVLAGDRAKGPIFISDQRERNGNQDVRLAGLASKEELQKLFGACDAPPSTDPEWYLRIRDYLLRPH